MKAARSDLLEEAIQIANDYRRDGLSLTLRQLYYQLVAGTTLPNSDKSYKLLGNVIGDARLRGDFDMDLLVDRGRTVLPSKQVECQISVSEGLVSAAQVLQDVHHWAISVDRWFGQPKHVSVWVEKDALSGVFETPCTELGVGFLACKGYPSHSALWDWIQQLKEAYDKSQEILEDDESNDLSPEPINEAVVLYFGDHDPDGWQIPRSAEETINTLIEVHDLDLPPIRFDRVALNMDQIRKYRPAPFLAKTTSTRFKGYEAEHKTLDAWELDALNPRVLQALIRSEVQQLWSPDIYQHWCHIKKHHQRDLVQRMADPSWFTSVLKPV